MASKFLMKISKVNFILLRQSATKHGNLLNPLRPKTPEDEYRDLFLKAMGPNYFKDTEKQLEKLNKRLSKCKGKNCGQESKSEEKESSMSSDSCKKENLCEEKISSMSNDGCKKESICDEKAISTSSDGCKKESTCEDEASPKASDGCKKQSKCEDKASPKSSGGCKKQSKCGSEATMRALVLDLQERKIELQDVLVPNTLKKDEVSIKVRYAAGNLTDLYVLEGKIPSNQKTIIPGRELSGVVYGTGDDVDRVRVGDNVVVAPCQPNTLCPYCLHKRSELCIKEPCGDAFGINRNGGWAQFTTVPASLVYKVCDVPLDKAPLLPTLAQVMCAMDTMKIEQNSHILIQGCGLAGMIFAQLLFDKGHENVYILEDNPKRVEVIKSMGTCYTQLTSENLNCHKFDIIFANGSGATVMQLAMDCLKSHGHFYVYGLPGKNGDIPQLRIETIEMSKRLLTVKGLSGTPVNPSKVPVDLANKILDCSKLGIPVVTFDDYNEALTQLTLGEISALIFKIDKC